MSLFSMERTYDADPRQVWDAWTVPERLSVWYNPSPDLGCEIEHMDVREGGTYRRTMLLPGGGKHLDEGVYHAVHAPHELVQGNADRSFTIRTVLTPEGEGTRMVVEMTGIPAEQHEHMRTAWGAGFDKLERTLQADP